MRDNPSLAYRQASVENANPVRLVILLYEQLVKDLQKALAALDQGLIEDRTNAINHALAVVGQLQGTLDMERGEEVARNLDHFYNVLRGSLLDAHVRGSGQVLKGQIAHLLELREAWVEVERQNHEPAAKPPVATAFAASDSGSASNPNWKA